MTIRSSGSALDSWQSIYHSSQANLLKHTQYLKLKTKLLVTQKSRIRRPSLLWKLRPLFSCGPSSIRTGLPWVTRIAWALSALKAFADSIAGLSAGGTSSKMDLITPSSAGPFYSLSLHLPYFLLICNYYFRWVGVRVGGGFITCSYLGNMFLLLIIIMLQRQAQCIEHGKQLINASWKI